MLVGSASDPTSVLGTVGVRGPVDYTVVHGRVTVEHGHLVTVDEEKLAHDAEAKCPRVSEPINQAKKRPFSRSLFCFTG